MTTPLRICTALFVSIALLASGCGDDDDSDRDALHAAAEELDDQRFEIENQIAECMRSLGFDYDPPTGVRDQLNEVPRPQPYEVTGFLDNREDWQNKEYGYVTLLLTGVASREFMGYVAEQPDDFRFALFGAPTDPEGSGCSGEAFGSNPLVQAVDELAEERTQAEARALAKLEGEPETTAWIECMQGRGFPIDGAAGPSSYLLEQLNALMLDAAGGIPGADVVGELSYDAASGRFRSDTAETVVDAMYTAEAEMASADYECSGNGYYELAQRLIDDELR